MKRLLAVLMIVAMMVTAMPAFGADAQGRICKIVYHVSGQGEKTTVAGRPNPKFFPQYADGTRDMDLVDDRLYDLFYINTGSDEILTLAWYDEAGNLGPAIPIAQTKFSKYAGYIPFSTKKNAATGSNVTGSMDGTVYEVVKDANGNIISKTPVEPGPLGSTPAPWATEAVTALKAWGKIDSSFFSRYQDKITRRDFAALSVVLYEALKKESAPAVTEEQKKAFTDTQDEAVLKAYALGLVSGYGNGQYGPADPITREQIAKLLVGACDKGAYSLDRSGLAALKFKDQSRISPWALEYVRTAYKNTIMNGTAELTISPTDNTTREQALKLIHNILKKQGTLK